MTKSAHLIEADDVTFDQEVLASELPVLVDFGARWCGPCKALAPIVERIAAETAGRAKVVVVDTDEAPRTAARWGIRGVPALVVFRGGQKTAAHLGVTSKEKILALLGV